MVYASGPRQRYQLAIMIVPCWLLTVIVGGVGFCIRYGLFESKVEWEILPMYTLGRLMVASNRSPRMKALDQGSGREQVNGNNKKDD